MFIIFILALIIGLPLAPLAQEPDQLEGQPDIESFVFEEDRVEIHLPAGGYVFFPGDEQWENSESDLMEWNHDDAPLHQLILGVDHFESPITETEFDDMLDAILASVKLTTFEASNISPFASTTINGIDWQYFGMELDFSDDSDGLVGGSITYFTYVRNLMYSVVFFYEDYWIAELAQTTDMPEMIKYASQAADQLMEGVFIDPPMPVAEFVLEEHSIAQFGITIQLPADGEFTPGDDPEFAELSYGPMQYALNWYMETAPAHHIDWFVIDKAETYQDLEWELIMESFLMGIQETPEIGTGNFEHVGLGETDWYWTNAGSTDPELPEERTLLFFCQAPGGIHMILAYANRGYEQTAFEQVVFLLGKAVLAGRESASLSQEIIRIDEFGIEVDFPGGGWLGYPGDEDWEYDAKPEIKFEWIHLDTPVEVCRIAVRDLGMTLGASEYENVSQAMADRISEEKGGIPVWQLEPVYFGDYTWYGCEFDVAGEGGIPYQVGLYYVTDLNVLYLFAFEYKIAEAIAAKLMIGELLGSFRTD